MTASDLPIQPLAALPDSLSEDDRLYLCPGPLVPAVDAGAPDQRCGMIGLRGTGLAFGLCEVIHRTARTIGGRRSSLAEIASWEAVLPDLHRGRVAHLFANLRHPSAGPSGDPGSPVLMGILNVTPDSFFDGGRRGGVEAAVAHARRLVDEGADVLDVGGESTRPGAAPVGAHEELSRVVPVLDALVADGGFSGVTISIDTQKAVVMEAALARGIRMINDVSALTADPRSLAVAAGSDAQVVLMHRQGTPETMNQAPHYVNAPLDVFDALEARVTTCVAGGIDRDRILVDPGIGFGKGSGHTLEILRRLALFHGLGCRLLLGLSRKGLTGMLDRKYGPEDRLPGSLAAATHALNNGARVLRVHDVAATRQAVEVWERLSGFCD